MLQTAQNTSIITTQPALLYLVPGVIIPVMLLALVRGEFKELWNWPIVRTQALREKESSPVELEKDV